MIFFHKPYYNPNKKNPSDIYPKPKKLYKVYKSYNAKQIFFLKIGKTFETEF
jgi:hypothetical protein